MNVIRKIILVMIIHCSIVNGQKFSVEGYVYALGKPLPLANISINNNSFGTTSDLNGKYLVDNLPTGNYEIKISYIGFKTQYKKIEIINQNLILDVFLYEDNSLNEVVISATRTAKQRNNLSTIVNILKRENFENVQACNLSEGLQFQPGLRIETNCQTCNYTQLRINGLGGGYSQILINGRPIFSPLTGLYGLDQMPVNMIERVETIRGGASTLYGSSSIAGVVNIITKVPTNNYLELSYVKRVINGSAFDDVFNINTSLVTKNKTSGISIFANKRVRDVLDLNNDNYTELAKIENNSIGISLFKLFSENEKIEASLSYLKEYRFGGEIIDRPIFLKNQAEERKHDIFMGSLDYEINFPDKKSSLVTYIAGQLTDRNHFTGILPDNESEIIEYTNNPPFGSSENTTFQAGFQYNYQIENSALGNNVLTLGIEYILDKIYDEISAYNFLVDQNTKSNSIFFQSDWEISKKFNFLTGIRADKHNLIQKAILSPRVSALYKLSKNLQLRGNWSTGFRAPQAFDADLHTAFAGGGVSRINLNENLKEEKSNSFSASINFDKASEKLIYGFTFEGFYTTLKNVFVLTATGEDEFGETFEKQNGDMARVKGITSEFRLNYNRTIQLECGFNVQSSLYENSVVVADGLPAIKDFLKTPNMHGFGVINFTPNESIKASINYIFTGPMKIAHFSGAPEQLEDEIISSSSFSELGFKTNYILNAKKNNLSYEIFGGIKNIFNSYQKDFDSGKNRDSNYIYGPSIPRTFFLGIKFGSFK